MRFLNRVVSIFVISMILLSTATMVNAETSQVNLQQTSELVDLKEAEKATVSKELQNVQNELAAMENEIAKNRDNLAATELKITETNQLIESKKEEIVILEDKVLARKGVMEERLVSLQQNDSANFVIQILFNSESFNDLIQRATAASTLLNADKELFEKQKNDLEKIELEKAEIDIQEKILNEQYQSLAASQADLEQSLQKRQEALSIVQGKYNAISNELAMAEEQKEAIERQIAQAQEKLKREQQDAAAKSQQATNAVHTYASNNASDNVSGTREFYATATAYSHEESSTGRTAMGYNIKADPNMKLIAVDPSVIPLGSRVWVEGYGEAIAGDTGGAIKGHKIDVLMPSGAAARSWGRKTVKVVVLK